MHGIKWALLVLAVAASVGAASSDGTHSPALRATQARFDGELSVMTYNIHGLPWPVAWDRPANFGQIAETLRDLRAKGRNPHIVVLQEAFTEDARAIGREAGYPYVVDGPSVEMSSTERPGPADTTFAAADSWAHGEGLGKYVGSGLQILSDFPIVGVRRMAFPDFACAGYDCLARKGALLASVRLPDRPDPVDIITTHLNSRRSSGVPDARSIYAYRLQVGYLTDFIHKAHDPGRSLIVAGDFNVGRVAPRRDELLGHVRTQWAQSGDIDDAYGEAIRTGMPLSQDAQFSRQRARDWQFYTPGQATDIELKRIDVPFGHAADGSMFSDHVGYTAVYDVPRRASRDTMSITNAALPKA